MKFLSFFIFLTIITFTVFITYNFTIRAIDMKVTNTSDECYATLVTAYYKIKSKHTSDDYFTWMKNLLTLQDCIVVYTTEDLAPTIRGMRPVGFPLEIVILPLQSFKVAQMLDANGWLTQETLDHELKVGHSRELYWIWNEKTSLVHSVSQRNPFRSQYFAWLDIGAIRHSRFNRQRLMNNFPFEQGITLLEINEFTEDELTLVKGECRADFSRVNRIGGGMIGGDLRAIQDWNIKYYQTFKRYLTEGMFAGKDQSVMATSCVETNLCLLVPAPPVIDFLWRDTGEKDWFHLQSFFRGDVLQLPKRLNVNNIFY
eukprot:TRINITY_DN1503_c0_g1_i1.p1 TRINITY_DN1503_c0_g1~~TRINITY_DN1503_c0_g1_i1.p1  ORF type:complete len:314 (-),score=38.33 TRINITY_DN1503_c0_g1_i1:367-1308(-)